MRAIASSIPAETRQTPRAPQPQFLASGREIMGSWHSREAAMTLLSRCREVTHRARFVVLAAVVALACARQTADRFDGSPYRTTFVEVEKDVSLEVLDWGGQGRPLVLLPGAGNTA